MNDDLSDIETRLRATYRAVAATTALDVENPGDVALPPGPRRAPRLVAALATLGVVTTVILTQWNGPPVTTQVATQPSRTDAVGATSTTAEGAVEPTCGSQLPRPLDLPDGYQGPQRVASSDPGQLILEWTSATGSIVARWPPDQQFQQLMGQPASTPDGQPSVGGSGTFEGRQTLNGGYRRTSVFTLRNVASECRGIQIDVEDRDAAQVDDGIAWLSNRGLFISTVPLVVASEARSGAPAAVACNAPAGVAEPPNRGGRVGPGPAFAAPADALKAFVDADSPLSRNGYLELRLPDGSIAYAKEQEERPGSYVTVVHVVPTGAGWSVDRWEASGC